ncbi:MAG TPA: T9SS type A sorting domain-containing protein, partial [Ignavibacteriaceae bacterium]|nr:T9SS type A sorting domain-containing protein [Ignavibacteriaceae bacterium]
NFIEEDKEKKIWIGSDNSLISIDGNKWENYIWQDTINPLGPYSYGSFAEDNSGNLWFSIIGDWPTDGSPPISGLLKFDGYNWTEYRPFNSGLPVCAISQIDFSTEENTVWLATSVGPVSFDGYSWKTYDTIGCIIPRKALSCLKIDGTIKWFGSPLYGLLKFDGVNWKLFNTANSGLPYNDILDINVDPNNEIWISTLNGLAKYDNQNWIVYQSENSDTPSNFVTQVKFDKYNNRWISTNGGIVKFDGTTWTNFNYDNSPLLGNDIYSFGLDHNDNKWFSCNGLGISIYNENGISDVEIKNSSVPNAFILEQNYPNPFNPETNIKYHLKESVDVKLIVYNLLGQEVIKIDEGFKTFGSHSIKINSKGLSSGVYIYKLVAGKQSDCRKMLLLK